MMKPGMLVLLTLLLSARELLPAWLRCCRKLC